MDESELVDLDGVPVQTNKDGTITLYHRTTPENAEKIRKTGKFISKENADETFFSTKLDGQGSGYGDAIIEVKVNPSEVRMDDVFKGEIHVAVPNKKLSLINVSIKESDLESKVSKMKKGK